MTASFAKSSRHGPFANDSVGPDPCPKHIEIDVAAAQDEADALALELVFLLQRGGERCRTGAFRQVMRVGPIDADRAGDLVVADLHDAGRTFEDDRQRLRVWISGRDTVGARVAG